MARFVNIFVQTEESIEKFLSRLGNHLKIEFLAKSEDVGKLFLSSYNNLDILVYDNHGLEKDRDMDFPFYQLKIDIGPASENSDAYQLALNLAHAIVGKIQNEYKCMITFDIQKLLYRSG